jgi:transcription elongation GreA/GreB family factor
MRLWRDRQKRHERGHPSGRRRCCAPEKEATMSDDSSQRILDALDRLEAGQAKMRTDIMARIDRVQHIVEMTRDDIVVNFGNTDRVERIANGAVDDMRSTTGILRVMQRQIIRLQTDVQQLKGAP